MGDNEGYAFQITITGVPHGTVPHYASSVTFRPHEFPMHSIEWLYRISNLHL
jgi:hypothetical protein